MKFSFQSMYWRLALQYPTISRSDGASGLEFVFLIVEKDQGEEDLKQSLILLVFYDVYDHERVQERGRQSITWLS